LIRKEREKKKELTKQNSYQSTRRNR